MVCTTWRPVAVWPSFLAQERICADQAARPTKCAMFETYITMCLGFVWSCSRLSRDLLVSQWTSVVQRACIECELSSYAQGGKRRGSAETHSECARLIILRGWP